MSKKAPNTVVAVTDMNTVQLAELIKKELEYLSIPRKRCKTKKTPEMERTGHDAKCLKAARSDYCIRCLSRLFIARAKNPKAAQTFYEDALTLRLSRNRLIHMTNFPQGYKARNRLMYSSHVSTETFKAEQLERSLLCQIPRFRTRGKTKAKTKKTPAI